MYEPNYPIVRCLFSYININAVWCTMKIDPSLTWNNSYPTSPFFHDPTASDSRFLFRLYTNAAYSTDI